MRPAAVLLWREAASCHLLFAAGKYPAAVSRLRVLLRSVGGAVPASTALPADEAGALSAAADVFARLRAAVSARFPGTFGRPAA